MNHSRNTLLLPNFHQGSRKEITYENLWILLFQKESQFTFPGLGIKFDGDFWEVALFFHLLIVVM